MHNINYYINKELKMPNMYLPLYTQRRKEEIGLVIGCSILDNIKKNVGTEIETLQTCC